MNYFRIIYITLSITSISLFSCKSNKSNQLNAYKTDQIEIDLSDKMNPERIVSSFGIAYGMNYICTLNKADNLCVYRFDTAMISLEKLTSTMRNEVGIQGASMTKGCIDNY